MKCDVGCMNSVHAETNAIIFAARTGISIDGCTMYSTHSPCKNCANSIVNSGIIEVVYGEEYRDKRGLTTLLDKLIRVRRVLK